MSVNYIGDVRRIDGAPTKPDDHATDCEVFDGTEWRNLDAEMRNASRVEWLATHKFAYQDGLAVAPRILWTATADKLTEGGAPIWQVVVTGQPPHDHRRTYQIMARTEKQAVFEAAGLFEDEMGNLASAASDGETFSDIRDAIHVEQGAGK